MKKILVLLFMLVLFIGNEAFSKEETTTTQKASKTPLVEDLRIQNHIDEIGFKILNANKIDVRMVFVYDKETSILNIEPTLRKRQIIAYDKLIKHASSEAELAAFLSREICKGAESHTGMWNGFLNSLQIKAAPKKYELFQDKRGVDFMVTAGYNPLAMITYINKAYPQKRQDKISRSNLTSKRLAHIYEYIYTKYPIYLQNNEYIENYYYQNFLLTSQENRKKLHDKIKSGSKKRVKYE